MKEQDARLLAGHVLVDSDDVDAALAQRLQHRLQLGFQHREVAVDDRDGCSTSWSLKRKLTATLDDVFA